MTRDVDWREVTALLENLYIASARLEVLFPGRKFTLDGHLVGSVGEVVAAFMFDLELNAASTLGHDALAADGRKVEIKLTQGKTVALRHAPEHALILHRPKDGPVRVVYNGPGDPVWAACGAKQSNGQRPISLSALARLDAQVPAARRLPVVREAPV